jgi:hypothetical protein
MKIEAWPASDASVDARFARPCRPHAVTGLVFQNRRDRSDEPQQLSRVVTVRTRRDQWQQQAVQVARSIPEDRAFDGQCVDVNGRSVSNAAGDAGKGLAMALDLPSVSGGTRPARAQVRSIATTSSRRQSGHLALTDKGIYN